MKLKTLDVSKNDMCLAYFTIMLVFPYGLMFLGCMPPIEIINTINTLIMILLFSTWTIVVNKFYIYKSNMKAFILFFCWVTCVILLNVFRMNNIESLMYNANAFSLVALVYIFFVSKNDTFSHGDIRNALLVVVGFATLSSLINIFVNYETIIDIRSLVRPYDARFTGVFLGRNQFGGFLFLSVVSYIFLHDIFNFHISKVILALIGVNLILTFSRAPILATFVFLFISKYRVMKVKNLLVTFCILTVLSSLYFSTSLGEIVDKFLIRKEIGSAGRIERWCNLFCIVLDNPLILLGISPAGFKELMLRNGFGFAQIDNAYLEILVSYGLIGSVLYVFLFVYSIYITMKKNISPKIKKDIVAFVVSFFIYNILEAMVLFEAGLIQWVATLLFVVVPRFGIERLYGCDIKNE